MKFRLNVPAMSLYPGGIEHWWDDMTTDEMVRIVQTADELGFDSLHVPEHVAMHHDQVGAMGPRWVHVTAAMSWFAAVTKRIKIAGLIVVPYHNPVELAKMVSTIDWLSNGRVVVVAAVGYMEWEYELLRTPPFAERGKVMDEYMESMIELWSSDTPEYHGTYVDFQDIAFEPRPVQQPHPTIWLAGNSHAAIRRAARFADGWSPNAMARSALAEGLAKLHARPEWERRDPSRPFDVFLNLFEREMDLGTHQVKRPPQVVVEREAVLEQVHQLAAIGVTMTDVDSVIGGGTGARGSVGAKPVESVTDYLERLHWFAEEILPEARGIIPAG